MHKDSSAKSRALAMSFHERKSFRRGEANHAKTLKMLREHGEANS